jgi:hypothetical protein
MITLHKPLTLQLPQFGKSLENKKETYASKDLFKILAEDY